SELVERQQFLYPPYIRLVRIILKHTDRDLVQAAATMLASDLREQLGQGVLGPQTPLVAKVKNKYLMDIWVKIKKDTEEQLVTTKAILQQASRRMLADRTFKTVKLIFDVDPM
ncbi:MAG: primosomal protein N', partial [Bacteroidota bacterium]